MKITYRKGCFKVSNENFIKNLVKLNTLYVIGNGFDLYHKLHTTTEDYCAILSTKEAHGSIDNVNELFAAYGNDWGEYEKSLGDIDLDIIDEEIVRYPDYLSDRESDRDDTIWYVNEHLSSLRKAVFDSLVEMVKAANDDIYDSNARITNLFKYAYGVISFNYTSTVEMLYKPHSIPILHIHGYYEAGEDLLFGYKVGNNSKDYRNRFLNPLDDSRDYYVDHQRETIAGFYDGLKKELQLKKLSDFLCGLSGLIHNVCVMGHSMSDVDYDYMELIETIIQPQKWYVSQFCGEQSKDKMKMYSFSDKVIFYSLRDLSI